MRLIFFITLFCCLSSWSVHAQIDTPKKLKIVVPKNGVPKKEKADEASRAKSFLPKSLAPSKTPLKRPEIPRKRLRAFETPSFSMFNNKKLRNPGELFESKINDNIRELRPSESQRELMEGRTTDQYFGDISTLSKTVTIMYRDYGQVDGDFIRVSVNDRVLIERVMLVGSYTGITIDLEQGFNKIDFLALTQGELGPNTAAFKLIDDTGQILTTNNWSLATGVKGTVIVIKE